MNEQIWRTFKTVGEYRTVSRAARHLNLSQAAVSQHIHRLESDYGVPLFVRTSQGMVLNDAGEIAYRDIANLLAILDQSRQRIREHQDRTASRLTMGASLTIAEYVLPHALTAIDPQSQDPNIVVRMANSHDVFDQVVERDIDMGLVEAPVAHPEIAVRPFLEDRLKVVVTHYHPWANRSEVTLEELSRVPLIVREPGSGTRLVLEEALRQVGSSLNQLNIRFVLGTTQAIKAMIARGMGVSVLSPYCILPGEKELFHVLAVREMALTRNFSVVHHHDLAHTVAHRLIRILFNLDWAGILG